MENLMKNKSKILKVTFLATMLLTGENTCGMESRDPDNNCMCCQKCCESCKDKSKGGGGSQGTPIPFYNITATESNSQTSTTTSSTNNNQTQIN